MAVKHISIRLAWHDSGWNGHVCKDPSSNSYCEGQYSYPGERIKNDKDHGWESRPDVKGCHCTGLDKLPPCVNSINAFGTKAVTGYDDPPSWFGDDSKRTTYELLPATVGIWPYEVMYSDEVKNQDPPPHYDPKKRRSFTEKYFAELSKDRSLLIYYANQSNPFSEEDDSKYVIVGISRFKQIGAVKLYDGVSQDVIDRYGGFVWQMPVTSNYPEEGLRLPYEKYMEQPEILNRLLFVPENSRGFKYATREIDSDDILTIVETFLEKVKVLQEIGDTSENWSIRKEWLQGLLSELWLERGAFPGLTAVLKHISFGDGIEYFRNQSLLGNALEAKKDVFKVLNGDADILEGIEIENLKNVRRNWLLKEDNVRDVLEHVFPRLSLSADQIAKIISENRENNSIISTLEEIRVNPYLISEQYVGDAPDDLIYFSRIDHGLLPSPDLNIDNVFENNAPERLRALCVERLKKDTQHAFVSASKVLHDVDDRLAAYPEWKQAKFSEGRYLDVDRDFISKAIHIHTAEGVKYLYLRKVYEDELAIRTVIQQLIDRSEISLKSPINEKTFKSTLLKETSSLYKKAQPEYERIIELQAALCSDIFPRSFTVLSGAAGTGKTTVIESILKAIEKAHGAGTSFCLLAPTGKAAEKIKQKTGKPAFTIHSFLASRKWLNKNLTYKRAGGTVDNTIHTLILDESSMVDLELFAALFRAVNWNSVQRLILVGDPNQLPPIGRGKVFADVIDHLKTDHKECLGKLTENVRQLENRIDNNGTGILDLATVYVQENHHDRTLDTAGAEQILKRVQEGGDKQDGNVDKDLKVLYWKDDVELKELLLSSMKDALYEDIGSEEKYPWTKAHELKEVSKKGEYIQVISPYRGDFFGTEHLNVVVQKQFNGYWSNKFSIDGISIYDKVIQIRNRPKSNPMSAYNQRTRTNEFVEIYNGEIGFTKPHSLDGNKPFKLERFQTIFDYREGLMVGYGKNLGKNSANAWIKEEKPEEWLELAYAISVHKSQGSEFDRVFLVLPKKTSSFLSMELLYTAITRAQKHLTILLQEDISTLTSLMRLERSALKLINSSVFRFNPLPEEILKMGAWYEEGKIHATLSEYMVRSKSEVIIANLLSERGVEFQYETPLFAKDGTFYLPDFTILWRGEKYYWEHLGMLEMQKYSDHWELKKKWYNKFFPEKLITTQEGGDVTTQADNIVRTLFS